MVGSAGDVHLGRNVQLGENVKDGVLISFNVFCTQGQLHQCHISFSMTYYDFDQHIKKTCRDTLVLVLVLLRVSSKMQKGGLHYKFVL